MTADRNDVSKGSGISVVIADANPIVGHLLKKYLTRRRECASVSYASDKSTFLELVHQVEFDVALVSETLHEGPSSGLDAVREVRQANPRLRTILMLDRPEPISVIEGLRAGARGIFPRCNFDFKILSKCVRCVFEGQVWIGNAELEYVLVALSQSQPLRVVNSEGLNLLSRREEEVMRLVAEGLGNREIAEMLSLSEHTVKNYIFHIFDKLGISNRVELVLYAVSAPRGGARPSSQQEKRAGNSDTVRA